MAIPKLKKQDVIDALKFIDENGVPEHNTSVNRPRSPRVFRFGRRAAESRRSRQSI